jgi:hypothetical protein
MSFYLNNFNFINFKKETLFLFNPVNKIDGFDIKSVYFMHLTESNGEIIMKFPFRLLTLNDNENTILNLYMAINCCLDQYIGNSLLFNLNPPAKYAIYISVFIKNYINPSNSTDCS